MTRNCRPSSVKTAPSAPVLTGSINECVARTAKGGAGPQNVHGVRRDKVDLQKFVRLPRIRNTDRLQGAPANRRRAKQLEGSGVVDTHSLPLLKHHEVVARPRQQGESACHEQTQESRQ